MLADPKQNVFNLAQAQNAIQVTQAQCTQSLWAISAAQQTILRMWDQGAAPWSHSVFPTVQTMAPGVGTQGAPGTVSPGVAGWSGSPMTGTISRRKKRRSGLLQDGQIF